MKTFLVLNGPNLNTLGTREPSTYGSMTLADIERMLLEGSAELRVELLFYQANSEGALIDHLQRQQDHIDGVMVNPGALTHYGLSLRDALAACGVPVVEVHLSNIYAREDFRHESVVAPIARGQVTGFGWRSYLYALRALTDLCAEERRS